MAKLDTPSDTSRVLTMVGWTDDGTVAVINDDRNGNNPAAQFTNQLVDIATGNVTTLSAVHGRLMTILR